MGAPRRGRRAPAEGEVIIAEAAVVEDPDLSLHRRAGFSHVPAGEIVLIYLVRDYERYTLEEDGSVAVLYIGRRYDAATLAAKGPPKRSNDPEDLRQWWLTVTGSASSSKILIPPGRHGRSGDPRNSRNHRAPEDPDGG